MLHYSLSPNVMPSMYMTTTTRYASRPNPSFLSRPLNLTVRLQTGLDLLSRPLSLSPVHSANAVPSLDLKTSQGLSEFVEMELQVRDYELDQHGEVNPHVYSNYCQHGHQEFLVNKLGIDIDDYGRTNPVAVSDLSLEFLAPLKGGEKFVLKLRVSHVSIARVFFQHFIYKLPNYEPILEAKSTLVSLDENHRLARLPPEIRRKFAQLGLYK